ncbi:MAG: hypothetical protein HFG89_00425 [Dorea sp.]|jgi:hypothetical protein|nr:hypothetical protein [Dorea sp.]
MTGLKERIQKKIIEMSGEMADCSVNGFSVEIRPTKEGVKITSHKAKELKGAKKNVGKQR